MWRKFKRRQYLTKMMGTLFEVQNTFLITARRRLLRMGNVSEKTVVEKIKTHILFLTTFFLVALFMR
jgi:hypothetical protein